MTVRKFQIIWWPPFQPHWTWNGFWFSRDMGAYSFLYRWRLMLGWLEIRRFADGEKDSR